MNSTVERTELDDQIDLRDAERRLEGALRPNYWAKSSWIKEQLLTPGGLCILALFVLCLAFVIFGSKRINGIFARIDRASTVQQLPSNDTALLSSTRKATPLNGSQLAGTSENSTTPFGVPVSQEPGSLGPVPVLNHPASPMPAQTQHPSIYMIAEPGAKEPRLKTIVNQ